MARVRPVADPAAEAAQWFARRQGGGGRGRELDAFERWADETPANAEAYADLETLWREIGAQAVEEPIMALRREALAVAPARSSRNWLPYISAAAILLVFVGGFSALRYGMQATPKRDVAVATAPQPDELQAIYRTQVGERSIARLPDGSTAQLNTDTLIRVDYTGDERRIELMRGEAMFDVEKNPARPFVVEAGDEKVVALGTSFTVRRESASVEVTLLTGKVAVERDRGIFRKTRVATLAPGQQLVASTTETSDVTIRRIDLDKVASWRSGYLSFDGEPLGKVVAELNRYTTRKIEIADPSLGELPVSGVFRTGSTDSIVAALQLSFPVERVGSAREDRIVLDWAEGGKP